MTLPETMRDPALFGRFFLDLSTWAAWEAFIAALFGLRLTDGQLAIYRRHTGRQLPPLGPAREAWLVVGRRGGKSRIAALIGVYLACFRDYGSVLAPGERGTLSRPTVARRARSCATSWASSTVARCWRGS